VKGYSVGCSGRIPLSFTRAETNDPSLCGVIMASNSRTSPHGDLHPLSGADHEITRLLVSCQNGDGSSLRALMAAMYDQLRAMAHAQLQSEREGHTLQPTALVHEAFIKLLGTGHDAAVRDPAFAGRAHLFAAAAKAMRRILVDHARAKGRIKRGGESVPARRVPLAEVADSTQLSDDDMLALDDALDALAKQDPRAAHIVELRFIVGLSLEEIAGVLEIHERTIRRQWLYARAYLLRELGGPGAGAAHE
jgi:RNA polymerase sigma factor (TIGR02999 family)